MRFYVECDRGCGWQSNTVNEEEMNMDHVLDLGLEFRTHIIAKHRIYHFLHPKKFHRAKLEMTV